MAFRTYRIVQVVIAAILSTLFVGFLFYWESVSRSADYLVPELAAIFLIILVPVGFRMEFDLIEAQLDRDGDSVPMPGVLGSFFDIKGGGPNSMSAGELVDKLSPDQGQTSTVAKCPQCGAEEPVSGSSYCRVCGAALSAG